MKTLFLTGGNGEIGGAIGSIFKDKNYNIIAPKRSELNLDDVHSIKGYMQDFKQSVDVFIHCAGFNEPKTFVDIQDQDINRTMTINSLSFYHLTQALLHNNCLKENSYVLGISSIYGLISRKNRFSYTASKYCLNGMVKSLSLELAPRGIKVNVLSPGFVATKMTYKNNSEEKIQGFINKIPLRKLAQPLDIAKTAYYLCSDDNAYITGQNIVADGGYTSGGFEE